MTAGVVPFSMEKALRRSGEPLSFDSDGKPLQLFAYEFNHNGKRSCLSLWASSWEDAEDLVLSVRKTLTLEGRIVEEGEGDFLL